MHLEGGDEGVPVRNRTPAGPGMQVDTVPPEVVRHLTATGGVADEHGLAQVESVEERGKVARISVMSSPPQVCSAAVPAPVVGDHTIALRTQKLHLRVPGICGERPTMREHDRAT